MRTCSKVFAEPVAKLLAIAFLNPFESPQRELSPPLSMRRPSAKEFSAFCSSTFCLDLLLSCLHLCGKLSLVGNLTWTIASTTTESPFLWYRSRRVCSAPSRIQHLKTCRIFLQYKRGLDVKIVGNARVVTVRV